MTIGLTSGADHTRVDRMPPDLHSYLCSYCSGFFDAPAGSVDRTREVRCPPCATATPSDEDVNHRLRWMTA